MAPVTGNVIYNDPIDTNKRILLKNIQNGNAFSLLYGHTVDSGRQVVQLLNHGQLVATLRFPIADIEGKNFSIHHMTETAEGFQIQSSWGGGRYFYEQTFPFTYWKDSFFAYRVNRSFYQQDTDEKVEKDSIFPAPINIRRFDPVSFIEMN